MNSKRKILNDEFEKLSVRSLPIKEYFGKTFFVTGATGLLGSLLVKSLLYINNKYTLNMKVIAAVRNKAKFEDIFEDEIMDPALFSHIYNLGSGEIDYSEKIDFIIHTASVTSSREMVSKPVDTIFTAVNGTEEILELAKKNNVDGMVYLSSMEIYGQPNKEKVSENDLGFIDISSTRTCYPESKRMSEMLCTAYAAQYGVNVKSARLAQTFGAGVLDNENRVFAQFARSVIEMKDIVLHTNGESEGNYVYTFDAIVAILILLCKGNAGEAYNINNEECHTTIKGMAEMLCNDLANNNIKVVIDLKGKEFGYAPKVKIWLDNSKMRRLGWRPMVGLRESYIKMIDWMNATK